LDRVIKPAVVLLSGGLDSATTLAIATAAGYACHCLSIDYGQRHVAELDAALRVAASQAASSHRTVKIDMGQFGGSALTDAAISVPIGGARRAFPVTYVPARNTIMLSLAPWPGPRCLAPRIFSSVSMPFDYSGYLTVVPSTSGI
jgi:7-cyano-7-deazaguanine synthase